MPDLAAGTVGAALVGATADRGDKPYLMFEDDVYTFAQIDEASARVANGLREIGVERGSHVALILPNTPEFLLSWFGAARVGAPVVPVNTGLRGDGLVGIVDHSDAATAIVHTEYLDRFARVIDRLPKIERVVVVGETEGLGLPGRSTVAWDRVAAADPADADAEVSPTDLMMVMYTSGTTGLPKGVSIQQASVLGGAGLCAFAGVTPDDVFYTCLPLFHANAAIISVWGAFGLGTRLALGRRFSASRFWDEIRRYGATEFNALGAMMPILYKQPVRSDDADNPVRLVLSAACPKDIWRPFEKRFGVQIIEFYGTVEGGLTMAGPDAPVGSIGKPLPINEMKVVHDDDTECAVGEVGELVSRPIGRPASVAYYKDTKASEEKTRGGWLRSGDLAYIDADGYLWFVDRKKDSIRRRGENISSFEVEKVLNGHPSVLESAVYAIPAELGEDEVMAALVLVPGASFDPIEVIRHCEEHLAYFQIPRFLRVVDELPKTGTHRVQKAELREAAVTPDAWDREAVGYEVKR